MHKAHELAPRTIEQRKAQSRNAASPVFMQPVPCLDALDRSQNYRRLRELESQEPQCSCTQADVDLFDARGCELHDRSSSWNVALAGVTPVERWEEYPASSADCPF